MRFTIRNAILPLATGSQPDPALAPVGHGSPLSYALDEIAAAGITGIVAVLPEDVAPPPELRRLDGVRIVRTRAPAGPGAALLAAASHVEPGPLAVIEPEMLIPGGTCLREMKEAYRRGGSGHLVATCVVPREETDRYVIVDPLATIGASPVFRAVGIVARPDARDAPSDLAAAGRYILHPRALAELEAQRRAARGPICLTRAICTSLPQVGLGGFPISGRRYDCTRAVDLAAARIALAPQRVIRAAE